MGWNNLSSWMKGGIIGSIIGIFLNLLIGLSGSFLLNVFILVFFSSFCLGLIIGFILGKINPQNSKNTWIEAGALGSFALFIVFIFNDIFRAFACTEDPLKFACDNVFFILVAYLSFGFIIGVIIWIIFKALTLFSKFLVNKFSNEQ